MAKWLSVRFRTKWLWVGITLQSLRFMCIAFKKDKTLVKKM